MTPRVKPRGSPISWPLLAPFPFLVRLSLEIDWAGHLGHPPSLSLSIQVRSLLNASPSLSHTSPTLQGFIAVPRTRLRSATTFFYFRSRSSCSRNGTPQPVQASSPTPQNSQSFPSQTSPSTSAHVRPVPPQGRTRGAHRHPPWSPHHPPGPTPLPVSPPCP